MTAPERIRVAQDADGFWTCREAVSGSQEYVRADLYAALEANLAAVKEALDEIQGKGSALRQGGPDPMDLHDLSDALAEATDLAADALSALEATPAPMVTQGALRVQEGMTYLDGFGLPHGPMTVPSVHHPAWPFEDQYGQRYGKNGIPALGSDHPKRWLTAAQEAGKS